MRLQPSWQAEREAPRYAEIWIVRSDGEVQELVKVNVSDYVEIGRAHV